MNQLITYFHNSLSFVKDFFSLSGSVFYHTFKGPFYYRLMIQNMYDFGYRSLFIVIFFAMSVGFIVTLHTGYGLENYGAKIYVSKMMILSLFFEIGTVLIVFILAGKIGSGITSEIASMKISEQLEALRALGVSPLKRVIIPKVLACFFIIPILCIFVSAIGLLTSAYVGKVFLQLDFINFLGQALLTPPLEFFLFGVFKTFVFAFFIAITSCHYGLKISKGSYEMGQSTMRAFVVSFILIIFGDLILTTIYYNFIHFGGK